MKQILFVLGVLFLGFAHAQRITISSDTTNPTFSANCIVGNSKYNVTESIYTNSEIGTSNFVSGGTAIEKIGLNIYNIPSSPFNVVDSIKIYFKDVSPATTTFPFLASYNINGYKQVFNGTISPTTTGFYEIQ